MKAVVIGATGHIGTYLVPQLAEAGYEVTAVTRSASRPYEHHPAWDAAQRLLLDRSQAGFARAVADVGAEVVVDLVAFTPDQVRAMVDALTGGPLRHYLVASSIWADGRTEVNPVTEDHPRRALDQYGRDKTAIEEFLRRAWQRDAFPATVVMPGQISGPGWDIISPLGNTDHRVFQTIAESGEVVLPNFGQEILHHVHGYDVAQVFRDAVVHREAALGECFHAVADEGLTTYGCALAVARVLGAEPRISFLGWERWVEECGLSEDAVKSTYLHLARSGHFSNEKARRLLGYRPRYTTTETVEAAVRSYAERGIVTLPQR